MFISKRSANNQCKICTPISRKLAATLSGVATRKFILDVVAEGIAKVNCVQIKSHYLRQQEQTGAEIRTTGRQSLTDGVHACSKM
jgi:hypothetical protein